MSSTSVVLGAGPVGSRVARLLADRGEHVRVVTRSGSGPQQEGVERIALDATDSAAFARTADGAQAIYNCANPKYHQWARDWPPLNASLLNAAEASGAVLATCSNLYVYGPVDHPIRESDPLAGNAKGQIRADMWRDALALHEQGRIRMTEARGSDYLGAGANSLYGDALVPRLMAGKTVIAMGDLDAAHTFTYVADVAATLVHLAGDERAWGRAWHVPSDVTCTQREAVASLAAAAGVEPPTLRRVPWTVVRAAGLAVPFAGELRFTRFQWDADFVMDSSAARTELGLAATPPEQVWKSVIDQYR